MRVRPILFNIDMVRAILDERKTVTRRVVRPKYKKDESGFEVLTNMGTGERWMEKIDEEEMSFDQPRYVNPPYQPGDILYVRETWFYKMHMENLTAGEPDLPSGRYSSRYIYKADDSDYPASIGVGGTGWRPSIHMPKEAARIWLKVTDVRAERLQDITEEQAVKEGGINNIGFIHPPENEYDRLHTAKEDFQDNIWNSTIKKKDQDLYSWDANPWVWVIEFERCGKPESEDKDGK